MLSCDSGPAADMCECTYVQYTKHSSCRCPARVQAALFLAAEFLYSWLHLRPLMPLILPENVADEAFLRDFTTGTYFASELFLFCLLAFASPIRCSLHLSATSCNCSFFPHSDELTDGVLGHAGSLSLELSLVFMQPSMCCICFWRASTESGPCSRTSAEFRCGILLAGLVPGCNA